jgi:hypothetical protein
VGAWQASDRDGPSTIVRDQPWARDRSFSWVVVAGRADNRGATRPVAGHVASDLIAKKPHSAASTARARESRGGGRVRNDSGAVRAPTQQAPPTSSPTNSVVR